MENMWFALGLTLVAGLATGVGSMIAFMAKRSNYRFLSITTGFSAGVMLYVSFVEILQKGKVALTDYYGLELGNWINVAVFFTGILFIALIDTLIPQDENPHEIHQNAEFAFLKKEGQTVQFTAQIHHKKMLRTGLFTALAITIHNFPEGLATFMAAMSNPQLGVAIAVAIALHNIPEGISVSIPIFYATGNRRKAFTYSILSGLSEPFGAIVALIGLKLFSGSLEISNQLLGLTFGFIAGIMVYISLDELLPASRAYGKGHDSLIGLIGGMLVMALSLLLMQ